MGEKINQYFAKDGIYFFEEDDDDYLLPHNNNDSAFKFEQSSEKCNVRGSTSLTDEEKMNKYFSEDSIFRSEDEDEESRQVKNQWKPGPSREPIPQEDPNKNISPTVDGEYVFPAKTQERKQETSSNLKAIIEVEEFEESSEQSNARGSTSLTDEEKMNKYFSEDSIFRSENEDEESRQVTNQWKPGPSRESIPQEDPNKNISPTVDGEYVFPAKTQERKQETSSNLKARIEVDDEDYVLPYNYKDLAFKMEERSELSYTKKRASPIFNGKEEVIPSKTRESKNENSSYFDENGGVVSKTLLPTRKTCDRKCVRYFRFVKEKISSKYEEIRSSVCNIPKSDNEGPLLLVSSFLISDRMANVSSITSYENGECWVAADGSKRVRLYNRDGHLIEAVNVWSPVDSLTIDKHGNVYMSCPEIKQVLVFNRSRHVKTFKEMTDFPRGIAYMKLSESILVCRNKTKIAYNMSSKPSNRIEKYSVSGTKTKSGAVTKTLFGYPLRVCVNVNNDCVVSDFANSSITAIDSSGRTRFSFKSSTDFTISYRHSVCCDRDGYIYIFSKGTPNVCILDSNGNVKNTFTCLDLSDDTCFAAVFDTDGYLWLGSSKDTIKIFKLSNQTNVVY